MAFGNNRGNQDQQDNVNYTVRGFQLYNPNGGDDSSTLKGELWFKGDKMGIKKAYAILSANPARPKAEQKDGRVYNYEVKASIALEAEALATLSHGVALVESQVAKIKKEGGNLSSVKPIAVRAGTNVVKVGVTAEYEGMDGDYYVGLFEVDEKGKSAGGIFFIFKAQNSTENTVMIGWTEESGKFAGKPYNAAWKTFKNFLARAEQDLVGLGGAAAAAHANLLTKRLGESVDAVKAMVESGAVGGGRSGGNNNTSNLGGFGSRRKRNLDLGGEEGGGDAAPDEAAEKGGKAPESKIDDISEIEAEMMEELGDIDNMG